MRKTIEKRKYVIQVLKAWKQSYTLANMVTKDETYIQKCIEEITGWGKMIWFVPAEKGTYVAHPECIQINFDPFNELKEITDLKNFDDAKQMNGFLRNVEQKLSVSLLKLNIEKFNLIKNISEPSERRNKLSFFFFLAMTFTMRTLMNKKNNILR